MKNIAVARRYAKALFELASQNKTVDDVVQAMSNLNGAMETTPTLGKTLFNPLVKPEEKQAIVGKITSNKLVLKFIELLARRKRLVELPGIYEELRALSDRAN